MELQDILQTLWLSENEVKVYLANLELWVTQIANISRISWIKRTTLYWIVEKMEEKNYIKKHVKNNIAYFEATNPDDLFSQLENKVKNLKAKLPELRAIDNKFSSKPKIYLFEWAENAWELYKMEAKDKPDNVRVFSSNADRKSWELNKLRKIRNEIYKKMWWKRANLNLIMNREPNHWEKVWDKFNWKYISKEKLNLDISIKIYWNKVQFISMKQDITWVVIENEDIAKTMKSIFDYIYKEK